MKKILALILFAATAGAQRSGGGWREFSIGPPKPGSLTFGTDGIRAQRLSLQSIVARAFDVFECFIVGPSWMEDEAYELTAIPAKPADLQPLLQKVLADRFHLAAHRETRTIPVYVLKSPPGPLKLLPANASRQSKFSNRDSGEMRTIRGTQCSMEHLVAMLDDAAHRPVLDETGSKGYLDFTLTWKRGDENAFRAAVKEQLGLELVDDRRPVELVIVDHIEKPTFGKLE